MKHWIDKKDRINGKPALRHSLTGELSIFGKLGEIYPGPFEEGLVVILKDGSLIKKEFKERFTKDTKFEKDMEFQGAIHISEFEYYYRLIKPVAPIDQLKLANPS